MTESAGDAPADAEAALVTVDLGTQGRDLALSDGHQ
jgi:hypothetical protein